MQVQDFLALFQKDAIVQTIAEPLKSDKPKHLQIKGLAGSLPAVLATALSQLTKRHQVFVLPDREEAAYFHNDLQNLLPNREIFFFPMSYKRAYQVLEIDNANILQRAEVLTKFKDENRNSKQGELIVTYPDALTEKVINKKSLIENTFTIKIGQTLGVQFITDFLVQYDFEMTDFVYEAGQFAVRGGIIDVFSYANELPYRIEFFGDEVESIRTFDPMTQLSVENRDFVSLIPNVQTKLLHEVRESFLKFLPKNTNFWFADLNTTLQILQKYFDKAHQDFEHILAQSGGTQIISDPETLFETADSFVDLLQNFHVVEFGHVFSKNAFTSDRKRSDFSESLKSDRLRSDVKNEKTEGLRSDVKNIEEENGVLIFDYKSEPQPSFNKDFGVIADHLAEKQEQNATCIITAEVPKQLERLELIFEEINRRVHFLPLNISLHEGFFDRNTNVVCYTDHQFFERYHRYKSKEKFSKSKALTLKELRNLQVGDYVTHIEHGVGRFAGLEKIESNGREQEAIRLIYRDDDMLYVGIHSLHKIAKFSGKDGAIPSLNKIGSQEWENKKKTVKKKVKDIAKELIALYAKRRAAKGYAFGHDNYLQYELESSFFYEDTPDQAKAASDVKEDMEKPYPMDRLVCGDVGFGKTEVAIRAAFKAVCDSQQVAVLVPTTVLAMQHYKTFSDRLKNFPCKVGYINRFKSTKEINETLKQVKEGKIDILIGTHRIVSKDVVFKQLGLVVIDEEQKFGVKTKDKLKEICVNVDVLTLTATPIPRTLHFSLLGARDLSVIATPPPNRQPVTTEIHSFNEEILRDAISHEIKRGGQVFFVHNRIGDIEEIANIVLRLVPDARIGYAHGQMEGKQLEKIMLRFVEGEIDVLVSTNIIEAGLDIPNANTIIINRAHQFGLSDLHQMRGRVGRSNRKAFCYLLVPHTDSLPADSRKRLSVLEEFSELGDGFKVAMRDLDIRGAGNLLGAEQSGFINDLGFETYHQLLDEAVRELKAEDFADLFKEELELEKNKRKTDCAIETDWEILIPDNYVQSISERLRLYSQADSLENTNELAKFRQTLHDRFGKLPRQVEDLLKTVQMRWLAEELGFEKLILKNGSFKAYFPPHEGNERYFQGEAFGKVIQFVTQNPKICQMKELKTRLLLSVENIRTPDQAIKLLERVMG